MQKGKRTERFSENSSRNRDSLKSEVRLPRDERHFSYESNEQSSLCLHQTRPRVIGAIGSNAAAPEPPLPSSRRVLPSGLAARVDEFAQNLDNRHVDRSSSATPPRYAHTVLCRRSADRLQFLRRSIKCSNHRGHAPRLGHRPCATQGLLRYSLVDPVRPSRVHHWQRSPPSSREEMFCAVASSTRAASLKQPRIVAWSTPTFCVTSRVPSFRVCLLFL